VLESKQVGRVLAAGFNCSIICELYWRTSRVQTCVIELLTVTKSCIREPVLKLEDSRSIHCNSRICHTCGIILDEL
jgi:hypothetical protein